MKALDKKVENLPFGLGDVVSQHIKAYFLAHEGQLPATGLYKRILVEVERPLFIATLEAVRGSQVKAAKLLGMSRNTLRKKLEELNINRNDA